MSTLEQSRYLANRHRTYAAEAFDDLLNEALDVLALVLADL